VNILALDTSLGACSAAVLHVHEGSRRLHFVEQAMERGHAEALMPMIEQVMRESGSSVSELDLVAATLGPGTFTGIRVAIAAARGIALASSATVWGTDTLTVLAAGARSDPRLAGKAEFAVAVDARRDRVYLGCYSAGGARLTGPVLLTIDEAAACLLESVVAVVGSGGDKLAEAAAIRGRSVESVLPALQPSAAILAELAADSGETLSVLQPLYLRPPDAKPQSPTVLRQP
jgi:tRNA threonylcarbamoyladenosine biosynthesis protein TsaB